MGNAFIRGTEVSAQQAALQVLNLPSHYSTSHKIFVPTIERDKRTFLMKPLSDIQRLPDNSTDIICSNHLQRYSLRPPVLKDICLAEWYSSFQYCSDHNKSKKVYKLNNGQFVKRLKTVRVIRFVEFSELRDPENFYREQLMLYYPFFEEEELLLGESHYEHAYHKVIDVWRKTPRNMNVGEQQ